MNFSLLIHFEIKVLTGEDWNTILYDGIIAYQVRTKNKQIIVDDVTISQN